MSLLANRFRDLVLCEFVSMKIIFRERDMLAFQERTSTGASIILHNNPSAALQSSTAEL